MISANLEIVMDAMEERGHPLVAAWGARLRARRRRGLSRNTDRFGSLIASYHLGQSDGWFGGGYGGGCGDDNLWGEGDSSVEGDGLGEGLGVSTRVDHVMPRGVGFGSGAGDHMECAQDRGLMTIPYQIGDMLCECRTRRDHGHPIG